LSKLKDISDFFTKEFKTTDVYKICDELNIPIKYDPLGNIHGHFLNYKGCIPIITLNKDLKDWQRYLVLSHELAHYILHRDKISSLYINDYESEYEATDFGLDILWPFGHISIDYLKKEVCEFIATMYPKDYRETFLHLSIYRHKPWLRLCGNPKEYSDIKLLDASISNTISFCKNLEQIK